MPIRFGHFEADDKEGAFSFPSPFRLLNKGKKKLLLFKKESEGAFAYISAALTWLAAYVWCLYPLEWHNIVQKRDAASSKKRKWSEEKKMKTK